MILIGEKLNSSIPSVAAAYQSSEEAVIELIKKQSVYADYLDVNTATCSDELSVMLKTISLILENSERGIVLDSPDAGVLEKAALSISGRNIIFNSVTENERIDKVAPIAKDMNAKVIALLQGSEGIPSDPTGRLALASRIVDKLTGYGVPMQNIYIDIIVQSVAFEPEAAKTTLDTLALIKKELPEVKTVMGASNVSYGLPKRSIINTAMITVAAYNGLDAAILDTTNESVMNAVRAADVLSGADEYCMDYISYIRGE